MPKNDKRGEDQQQMMKVVGKRRDSVHEGEKAHGTEAYELSLEHVSMQSK